MMLTLVLAGCGAASAPSPAWSFAAASGAPTAATSSSESSAPQATACSSAEPAGLGATCAVQWAASLSTYQDGYAGIPTLLLPKPGSDAQDVEPTKATLQTDQGPIDLSVAKVSGADDDLFLGTTRLELGLPVLEAGTYRGDFLDLADASGTWRFRVGEIVINVLAGAAPEDLEQAGGTEMASASEGGSV